MKTVWYWCKNTQGISGTWARIQNVSTVLWQSDAIRLWRKDSPFVLGQLDMHICTSSEFVCLFVLHKQWTLTSNSYWITTKNFSWITHLNLECKTGKLGKKHRMISLFIYLCWERERKNEKRKGRERGRQRILSGLRANSGEPDAELELTNCENVTWAEVRSLMNWATEAPREYLYQHKPRKEILVGKDCLNTTPKKVRYNGKTIM